MDIHSKKSQNKIIKCMLSHVEIHGWSFEALRLAVCDAGFSDGDEYRVFSGDIDLALKYYWSNIDDAMFEKAKTLDLSSMRLKDKIIAIIMLRISLLNKQGKLSATKVYSYLKHPSKYYLALSLILGTVSQLWYFVGDKATDFNFYTKRSMLLYIYFDVMRFWLQDDSEDFIATRAHLNGRIDKVMGIADIKSKLRKAFDVFINK